MGGVSLGGFVIHKVTLSSFKRFEVGEGRVTKGGEHLTSPKCFLVCVFEFNLILKFSMYFFVCLCKEILQFPVTKQSQMRNITSCIGKTTQLLKCVWIISQIFLRPILSCLFPLYLHPSWDLHSTTSLGPGSSKVGFEYIHL